MMCNITKQQKSNLCYKISVTILLIGFFLIGKGQKTFAQPLETITAETEKKIIKNFKQFALFTTDTGEYKVNLEVARSANEQEIGLMYRKQLADDAGMVFVYDEPQITGIWMKNTLIPLDIIFINCNGIVTDIVTREPLTLDISYPSEKICSIIEVNAGFNEKNSLKRGDKVQFMPSL